MIGNSIRVVMLKENLRSRFCSVILLGGTAPFAHAQIHTRSPKAATQNLPITSHSKRGGIELVLIPADWFLMGRDDAVGHLKSHIEYVQSFYMGRNLVTVRQFKNFCKARRLDFSKYPAPSWGWIDSHPMVNVTWQDASDFCTWAGGALPTHAQFEKAARGTDGRIFPWGNQWDGNRLQWNAKMTAPVGSHPNGTSPYGCLDLVGNVWQWCLEWSASTAPAPTTNTTISKVTGNRVICGGSFHGHDPDYFLASGEAGYDPGLRQDGIGFRMVVRT